MPRAPLARLILPSLLLLGCGGDDGGVPLDAPPTDAAADAFVTKVTETGTATDQVTGAPIDNAKVCANGLAGTPCAMTNASGAYAMPVAFPTGKVQIALVTTADGYLGRENDMAEDSAATNYFWETIHGLFSTADATTLLATDAHFTYPSTTTGFVEVQVFPTTGTGAAPSVTATISPAGPSGAVYGGGSDGTPDPTLTQTPGTSGAGLVYFGNLTPGTYQITVQSAGGKCVSVEGNGTINGEWPPIGSASVSAGVFANVLNVGIALDCP